MRALVCCDDSGLAEACARIEAAFGELGVAGHAFSESLDSLSAVICGLYLSMSWPDRWRLLQDENPSALWWVVLWRVGRLYYLSCVGMLPRLLPER